MVGDADATPSGNPVMAAYLPLITIFLSGLFALLVAVVTALLGSRTGTQSHRRTRELKRYEDTEALYVDMLASFDKCIRFTQGLRDYSELNDELSRLFARAQLRATKEINDQSELMSNLMLQWSMEYRRGAPKRIGDTGMAIIASHDPPHQENANTLYPKVSEAILKSANLMRAHLKSIEV